MRGFHRVRLFGTPGRLILLGIFAGAFTAAAEEPAKVDFVRDIQPILQSRCVDCHGPETQEGQLRLDARGAVFRGGISGPTLVKGSGAQSLLYKRVAGIGSEERMPLDDEPLSDKQLKLIRAWIDQGAPWPDGVGSEVTDAPARHWAYIRPQRPALPKLDHQSWTRNPIDAFVLRRLQTERLDPSPRAERPRLVRRLYLDLIGLPPTVDQVDDFLRRSGPDAYDQLVDSLLASPEYGVRWARPWLDAARYADSNGYQADQYRSVWPYRDWVIAAMNADMPFDQFTIEQLAGDLLPDASIQQKIATGFHRLTTCNVEAGVDPEENRVNQIIDRVNTTGTVWLGTSIECAQCHNHKYDPFTQRDYYQLFAYFNNTPLEVEGDGVTYNFVGPKMPLPMAAAQIKQREELQREIAELEQQLKATKDAKKDAMKDATTPADKEPEPTTRNIQRELTRLKKQAEALEPATTLVMVEQAEPRATRIFRRGNFQDQGELVTTGPPAALHADSASGPGMAELPANRLGLARWLVDPANPLTARVAVNRWWAEFFGAGIVTTLEDFGTQGEPPTHPQLLDWLACELVDSGWSMKHIHRLIVTSATYQQSSRADSELWRRDPGNQLHARGPRFRLPAEAIRDNGLAISGLLSTNLEGPPVFPPQPDGVWRHVGRNAPKYDTSTGTDRFRRGIFVFWRRSAPYPSFTNFDAPDRASCVVKRARTNTPLQALTLLNDPAYVEIAIALARRMAEEHSNFTIEEKIAHGFRLCVARQPDAEELAHLAEVFQGELRRLETDAQAATRLVAGVRDSTVEPAELAAWFCLANILLNLDETVTKG